MGSVKLISQLCVRALRRPHFKSLTVAISLLMLPSSGLATYDSNAAGRITAVLTYDGPNFLIVLDPMPAGPCGTYFIVPGDVPTDSRQQLLSRALVAFSKGDPTNIGYDGHSCVNGWYRVHRIG